MIFGVHSEVVAHLVAREATGHGPGDQHAVALEPQIPVQGAGMVLLDDEPIVARRQRCRGRHGLRCASRVTLTSVFLQPVGHGHIVRDGPLPRIARDGHANLMDG
jgi:hypothetical protein